MMSLPTGLFFSKVALRLLFCLRSVKILKMPSYHTRSNCQHDNILDLEVQIVGLHQEVTNPQEIIQVCGVQGC